MGSAGAEGGFSKVIRMIKNHNRLVVSSIALVVISVFAADSTAHYDKITPVVEVQTLPFEPGETLIYEGEFTRALLRGIDVAELRFAYHRLPTSHADKDDPKLQTSLDFSAEAISKGIVSKLFGLNFRQTVDSSVDASTFSVLRTTKLDEQGKRKRTSDAIFDRETGVVTFTELDPNDPSRPPRVIKSETNGTILDIASAIYYLRTQKLEPGHTIELLICDTGQVYRTPVTISKGEQMKTVLGKVATIQVVPEMFGEGRLIRGKGNIIIWFTADARHIPVRAKINNSLGRLDIKLKRLTHQNKAPVRSK